VGTGLDRVYSRRHLELARRIASEGLLLSEFALGTPPVAAHFPQRNRLIAGLAEGTLVVEAALASGSLITARLALDEGREVFAIPGSIHSPQSRGCNALIKQGAKLVDRAEDILEELQSLPRPQPPLHIRPPDQPSARPRRLRTDTPEHTMTTSPPPSSSTDSPAVGALLDALGFDPMTLDELVSRTGVAAHELSGQLLELELGGRVSRMPGQLFQRMERA
jgi:DNA processing protein